MIGYVKHFSSNKIVIRQSFKFVDKGQLKRYIKIWQGINNLIGRKFNSKPVYGDNDKYIYRN